VTSKKIFFSPIIFFYPESPEGGLTKLFQDIFDTVIFSKESLGISYPRITQRDFASDRIFRTD